jgi:GLPGLI family protein
MKKIFVILIILLGAAVHVWAQHAHFTTSGSIEFERRTNAYALIQKIMNKDNEAWMQPVFDFYKKNNPQFRVLTAKLLFGDDKTLFVPNEAEPPTNDFIGGSPMLNQYNTVFTDLATQNFVDEKKVFEQTYLVEDSLRKIKWKITDETRDIAGYTCRRANGIYLDSIYVVAFYTTRIPVPGGPESFNGLPGMILGVALPHENITWFATKVNMNLDAQTALAPPKKGKVTREKELYGMLEKASENWGPIGKIFIKGFML